MNQTPQDLQAIDQDDALLDSIVARHRASGDDPAARLLSGIVAALEVIPVPDATPPALLVPHGRRWGVRAGITGALTAGVLAGSLGAAAADVLPGPAQTVVAAVVNAMTPLHLPTRKERVQLRRSADTLRNQPAPRLPGVTGVAPPGTHDNQRARTSRTTPAAAPGQQPSATSTSSGGEPELHPAGQTGVNEADTNQGGQLGVTPSGTDQTSTDQTGTDQTSTEPLVDP